MVELLNLSDESLSCNDYSECNFSTSTPRRSYPEANFGNCSDISVNSSVNSVNRSGPPPPVPKTPKPQTAVTKSTVEDIDFSFAEKSLRKISSARELLECWSREINSPGGSSVRTSSLLKRRHSEILRRRFTTSLKAGQRSLDIVPEDDLPNRPECVRIPSTNSLGSTGTQRKGFDRNCPARKPVRSRATSVLCTSKSRVSTKSSQSLSSFGKITSSGKKNLQIPYLPSFMGKKCECEISFVSFV